MALVRSRCLILQTFPYSETSRILRLLTEEHGVQSVIAKGARRPKSRFGGLLEPFTEGTASFYHRESRDLHTLGDFDLDRPHRGVGSDLLRFAGASLLAEVVLHTSTAEPHPGLFRRMVSAVREIEEAPAGTAPAACLAGVWGIVAELGFGAETDLCVSCGVSLDDDSEIRFDPTAGGVSCVSCRKAGRPVPQAARRELRAFLEQKGAGNATADAALHFALLGAFLDAQLDRGRSFRSLDLLRASMAEDA